MSHKPKPLSFDGMALIPPSDFELVETVLSLRLPASEDLQDPRMVQGILKKRVVIQPNLVIHRRFAKQDASLEEYVGEACAELLQSIGALEEFQKKAFRFQDQAEGYLVSFNCPAPRGSVLRQYHAYRLDQDKLTSLTLTIDAVHASPEQEAFYLRSLASLQPTP